MAIAKSTSRVFSSPNEPALSSYTDYRLYLRDWYLYKKKLTQSGVRSYSYAAFSAAADIKSPNYLKLIIEGNRNLSEGMSQKFAVALKLSKTEAKEYSALVRYSQAQDPEVRNRYLRELSELRIKKLIRTGELKPEVWESLPGWVTWALLAMAEQKGVKPNVKELREALIGRVNNDVIEKTLLNLIDRGEIEIDENGELHKVNRIIKGAEDISAEQIRKLQGDLLYLGLESLFETEPDEREFGSFTAALTKEEFDKIKFELRQVRKRIYKDILIEREKQKGDRVYQLNIQLFPLTKEIS